MLLDDELLLETELLEIELLETELLVFELLLVATDDELLLELETTDELLDFTLEALELPTIPNGAGWLLQVLAEIQL